ncbi:MAG: FAD-dependent oxidoreductase, partial [Mariprofundaceae bacterium]|nr:FAD-dependent oxidoreductase [Mariprofundaceae bacterium]
YTESSDGRVMFFRPWQGKILVGTTEVELDVMPAKPAPTQQEIAAILATHNRYFPDSACTQKDIIDTFCGVRVLPCGDAAFAASRETLILPDDARSPAYLGVYGGKLTTYRREAEKALAMIARNMPDLQPTDTRRIPLNADLSDSAE